MKREANSILRAEDQRSILRIVSIFRLWWTKSGKKVCVNPIKTAVNHVILRANDLSRVKIKINLYFSPYVTKLDWLFAQVFYQVVLLQNKLQRKSKTKLKTI